MLLRGLPSLEGKNELFVGKKRKKRLAQPTQTDYSAPKRYAHFGRQTRTFCNKKMEKNRQPSLGQTDYMIVVDSKRQDKHFQLFYR